MNHKWICYMEQRLRGAGAVDYWGQIPISPCFTPQRAPERRESGRRFCRAALGRSRACRYWGRILISPQ